MGGRDSTPKRRDDATRRTASPPPIATSPPPIATVLGWIDGWRGAALVVAVGLVVRLLHLVDSTRLPLFDRPTVDAALYVEMAKRIAASFVWPEAFYKPPLYPYVLGFMWKLAAESWFLLRLPGVFCGAATCGVAWWIGRRVFGPWVGLIAGLLYALHRTAVYFEGELLEIGLVTFLHVAGLALVLRAGKSAGASRRDSLVAGLALGLGTVARPTLLLFDVVALVWLGRKRAPLALAALFVALLPVTLHNAVRGHDFVLVSSNLGVNYYLGNNPRADGRIGAADVLPANPAAAERAARAGAEAAEKKPLRPSQVSGYWLRRGFAWDAAHPGTALALLVRKLFYAWNAAEISDNEDLAGLSRYLRLYRLLPVGTWLLAPLGLVGLLLAPRRRDVLLLRLYVIAQIASLLPFFIVARFRLPWMPVLAVLAAWTGVEAARRIRAGAQRGSLLAPLAGAAVFCSLPGFGVRAPVDFDLEYKLGYAWQQKGDADRALAAYREAVRRNPNDALAQNALGVLLAERGQDLDAAAVAVRRAIELDPGRIAHYAESLAGIELRRGRAAAALEACSLGLRATDASQRASLLLREAQAYRALGDARKEAEALTAALAAGLAGAPSDSARARLTAMRPPGASPGPESP